MNQTIRATLQVSLVAGIAAAAYISIRHYQIIDSPQVGIVAASSQRAGQGRIESPSMQSRNELTVTSARTEESQSASIFPELEQATDYRVFVEELLRGAAPGRTLYIRSLLSQCANLRAGNVGVTGVSSSISSAQVRAIDMMNSRCAGFSGDELSSGKINDLVNDARMQSDPYRKLDLDLGKSGADRDARHVIISSALNTHDPLVLQRINNFFIRAETGSVAFNGHEYREPYAASTLATAWIAAICEGTSQNCGETDWYVTEVCATQGACFDTRQKALRYLVQSTSGDDGAALYDKVYSQFVNAIQSMNITAFDS